MAFSNQCLGNIISFGEVRYLAPTNDKLPNNKFICHVTDYLHITYYTTHYVGSPRIKKIFQLFIGKQKGKGLFSYDAGNFLPPTLP